jgi:Ni,Fe-hydrogenase III small subunit
MSEWVLKGIRSGVKSTRYPRAEERAPGVSPGLPDVPGPLSEEQSRALVARCPTGAIGLEGSELVVDYRRCVHCFRCVRGTAPPLGWKNGYEWAGIAPGASSPRWPSCFRKSLHIRVVDAGDCGACLNEVRQLSNPYYNLHRLGFFITPTPRNADILLVVGPVTDHMRAPLREVYEAMPAPKLVMAVGACALTGGVFGPSFITSAGVKDLLPVDIEVPGFPPPPLAILHGLLVAAGRKPPVDLFSPSGTVSGQKRSA